jgi:hypothetical protein
LHRIGGGIERFRGWGAFLELRRERVQPGLRLRELQLELRRVDALGLRDIETPTEKLQLLLDLLVGPSKLVSLGGQLHDRRVCIRESRFEVRDPPESFLKLRVRACRGLAHEDAL